MWDSMCYDDIKGGDSMKIGERIKLLRKDLNLTQSEFAEKINLKQAAIGMYENGSRNITEQSISLICSTFNVSKKWLHDGIGNMYIENTSIILNDASLDATDKEILQSYVRMTPPQRQFIKSWIKDIATSIDKTELHDDERAKAHQLLDQELDAEKEAALASTFGNSKKEKNA
jgi:transcriptional regulator with XRE-family HTH domain